MSDFSDYILRLGTSRLSNATAGSSILNLAVSVSLLNNPSSVMPLLELLGEFTAKAAAAGL
jgi:hypothetical protein